MNRSLARPPATPSPRAAPAARRPGLQLGLALTLSLGVALGGCGKSRSQQEAERVGLLAEQLVECQSQRDSLRERLAQAPGAKGVPRALEQERQGSGTQSAEALNDRLARCKGQQEALKNLVAAAEHEASRAHEGPRAALTTAVGPPTLPTNLKAAPRAANGRSDAADATRSGVAQLASPLRAATALDVDGLAPSAPAARSAGQDLKGQSEASQLRAIQTSIAPSMAPRGSSLRAGRTGPLEAEPPRAVLPAPRRSRPVAPSDPEAEARAAQTAAQLLRANVSQLKACYERGLKRSAKLQFVSRVQVRVTLKPEGGARSVTLTPRVDNELEACISRAVSHWAFPAYGGGPVSVEVPVTLRAIEG